MARNVVFRIVMVLVLIGAVVGVGAFAFRAGMMQGVAQSAQIAAGNAPEGQTPRVGPGYPGYPMYMMPFGRPMGFGFGFLGCLVPLFFLFLFFIALRGLFGRGPGMWGHRMHMHGRGWGMGEPGKDVPPFFEEWHKKMHEQPGSNPGSEPTDKQ